LKEKFAGAKTPFSIFWNDFKFNFIVKQSETLKINLLEMEKNREQPAQI